MVPPPMKRYFLQIVREMTTMRKAGVTPQFAFLASLGDNEAEWEVIWQALMRQARLEQGIYRFKKHAVNNSEKVAPPR